MGQTSLNGTETLCVLQFLEQTFVRAGYDMLIRNCCHFSGELCDLLGVGHVPDWLTSLPDAIVSLRSGAGGSKIPFQAKWPFRAKWWKWSKALEDDLHSSGDDSADIVDEFALGKAASVGMSPFFRVTQPRSQTPGAYAWQDKHGGPPSAKEQGHGQAPPCKEDLAVARFCFGSPPAKEHGHRQGPPCKEDLALARSCFGVPPAKERGHGQAPPCREDLAAARACCSLM